MTKPKKPMKTLREIIDSDTKFYEKELVKDPSNRISPNMGRLTNEQLKKHRDRNIHHRAYCGKYRRLVDFDSTNFIEKYPLTPFKDGPFAEFPPPNGVSFKSPPSANNMYVHKAGKLVKTKIYSDWLEDMTPILGSEFHEQRVDWAQSVGVLIYTNLRRKSDIDNIQKGILDCLVKAEIIPDDNFVDLLKTVRCKIPDEGFFMLNISKPFENDKYWHE